MSDNQIVDEGFEDLANLREFLAADTSVALGVETEEWPAGQEVDTPRANRFLRQLALLRDEERDVANQAAEEIMRVQEWRSERLRRIDARRHWLESALEAFARNRHEENGAKTFNLTNGTLRLRPSRSHVTVYNEGAFIAWALENAAELVRTTHTPAKDALAELPTSGWIATVDMGEFTERAATSPEYLPDAEAQRVEYMKLMHEIADAQCHRPMLDGTEVPGVLVVKPMLDNFTVTPK